MIGGWQSCGSKVKVTVNENRKKVAFHLKLLWLGFEYIHKTCCADNLQQNYIPSSRSRSCLLEIE